MTTSVKSNPTEPTAPPPPANASRLRSQSQPQPQPQPQPQSQPHSTQSSRSSHSPPQSPLPSQPQSQPRTSQFDARAYYGYMFNADKSPTDTLNALLRAVAIYISDNIGDRNVHELNPKKLAAFYHAVGGDYDSLFLTAPNKSISYIWKALGVQHSLQPTENDFEEPCIPTLTPRGFVRWESLQILLGPEEHVPFLQYAVRNWGLRHPETGRPFPVDLPREAFPATCDPDIDAWHKECGQKLRREIAAPEEHGPRRRMSDPRMHDAFSHARHPENGGSVPRRSRPEMDYFQRERPVAYAHVSGSSYARPPFPSHFSAGKRRLSTSSSGSTSPEGPPRRRSYSDLRPPVHERRYGQHLDPHHPSAPRRHSHPRSYSPSSDSEAEIPPRPGPKLRPHGAIPPPSYVRRMPAPPPSAPTAIPPRRRPEVRPDDSRRLSLPAIGRRISALLPGSSDRHRSSSREKRHAPNTSATLRKEMPPSRLSRSVSGESYASDDSDIDVSPRYPPAPRRDREHDRIRDRVLEKEHLRDREREEERERRSRREREYARPVAARRTSSHPDVDRRPRDYRSDPRDRDRDRGWDFDRDGRRVVTADERERRRYKTRGPSPTMTGVGGRRYPGEPAYK
ncbi:hypothetical protein F5B20DRAFT_545940 [Whalleya microplaca]|nr:hypothetical protein F5B20DRAFT_545940 [Whalleya microplaca]